MRGLCTLGLVCVITSQAHAEVSIGASIGAGAQGTSTYSALELRFDVAWQDVRLGLGARGVWDDSEFRTSDWSAPERAITILRALEAHHEIGETTVAIAGGALAPAHVGAIVDGYRISLDNRWRTGVRAGIRNQTFELGFEIDDVLDPALVAASTRYEFAKPWGMHASLGVDPDHGSVFELGGHRRYETEGARAELGVSIVTELGPGSAAHGGASAVAYATSAAEWHDITWSAGGDVRAGTGSVGALFGPLYRIERAAHDGEMGLWERGLSGGASAGLALGATAAGGWVKLGARARPDLPDLVVASGGAPMGRWVQGAVWAAASARDAAGAAELRVAWAKKLFSALQAARLYRFDATPMQPHAIWSVTAWFGVASE